MHTNSNGEQTPLLGVKVHKTPPPPSSVSSEENESTVDTNNSLSLKKIGLKPPSARSIPRLKTEATRRLSDMGRMETIYNLTERSASVGDLLRTSIHIPMPGKDYVVRIYLHYWLWQIPILVINISMFFIWYYTHYSNEPVIALTELGFLAVAPVMMASVVRDNYFKWFVYWSVKKSMGCPCTTKMSRYHLSRLADCIGGLHSSMGVSSFMWNIIYAIGAYIREDYDLTSPRVLTAFALPSMLFCMCLVALPCFRHYLHNQFEVVHRYVGWTSLCVLITHVILVNIRQHNSIVSMAGHTPTLFTLIIIFLTVYPWIILYRIPSQDCEIYTAEKSVMIIFPAWCRMGAICKLSYDWVEYHVLGITPMPDDPSKSLVLLQDLGDWTHELVEQCKNGTPPNKFYMHRIFAPNFTQGLFNWNRVFLLVTGSGIAPILPYVLHELDGIAVKLMWVARSHHKNYPEKLFDLLSHLPEESLVLHDTTTQGRPNLCEMALDGAQDFNAESVFVVSRPSLAYEVCDFCVRNGMPAFGSNFDV